MIIGYIIASKLRDKADKFSWIGKLEMLAISTLVFFMGLRMGSNDEVISNLGTIGLKSFVMTIIIMAGAVIAITITRKILKIDKFGVLQTPNALKKAKAQVEAKEQLQEEVEIMETLEEEQGQSSSMMTWIIVGFVVLGMALGFLFVDNLFKDMIYFDTLTANIMVVGLTILLGLIGFEMGLTGTVVKNFSKIGIRVVAFPIAVVIGTIVSSLLCGLLFTLSMKESLAIGFGFGWYTFAPIAIAKEGYVIASAISFMHNVFRELGGIILIPLLAKKIGFIEVAGLPGVAAMDICLPIVEKSTRQDIIVYSFAIGITESLIVPLLVPLIIGF